MVIFRDLIDDAKCFQTIQQMRCPERVACPHCAPQEVIKDGCEDTQPHRQVSTKIPKFEPAGYALTIGRLVNCRPMTVQNEPEACCQWYQNAFAWGLEDVRKLKPFPVRRQLGIFEVEMPASIC